MAAYHGFSSLRQSSSLSGSSSPSAGHHAAQPASPALSPPKDCRWKRGRPVSFSSRTFSTAPADSNRQAEHTAGIQTQEQSQQEIDTILPQSHQRSSGSGDAVVAMHQNTSAGRSPRGVEHDCSAATHTDRATTNKISSEEVDAADTFEPSSADTSSIHSSSGYLGSPDTYSQAQASSTGDNKTDEAADTDYAPSSTDRSSQQEDAASEAGEASEEASETHTPLEFQIPEDLLRAAMTAPDNSKASFWSSNLYRGPEDKRIAVHYCKTKEVAERVAQHFANEEVVGFDIEWKPYASASSIKKNVSLIQLACEDRIALFHVALFKGTTAAQLMPPTLKAILQSPNIYKVGVCVKGDFNRIVKFLGIEAQGVFELSRLHNLVQFSATEPSKVTNKLVNLAAQVQQHLQLPLYKGGHLIDDPEDSSNVRSSDWSLPLNLQQIHYAAADAYAGFRLYDALEEKRKQLKPTPPRPLVCDYDSKPKPRTSKPQKKPKTTSKTSAIAADVVEEATAPVQSEKEAEEEVKEELKDTQDTEGYETAQEELIDSHQLEGEEPGSSEESEEEINERDDNLSVDSVPLANEGVAAAGTDLSQKRVGRIDLRRLQGPDPEYPILPDLPGGSEAHKMSLDEDRVALDTSEQDELGTSNNVAKAAEESDSGSDEFEDSELEEALQGLNIDKDGQLWEDNEAAVRRPESTQLHRSLEPDASAELPQTIQELQAVDKESEHTSPAPQRPNTDKQADSANDSISKQEEHQPTPTLNSSKATESPAHRTLSSNPAINSAQGTSHTAEYNLATSWAQAYLASTVPLPTALTPSHIRATVPHLRAYSLWRHQGLSLAEVGRHLRDPPLSESTVGSYVLQAIVLERMEYDREEVKKVLMEMPEALRRGKWRGLAGKVGAN
ncbi:Exodeoxyribonuclease I [Ascochyta lentis]